MRFPTRLLILFESAALISLSVVTHTHFPSQKVYSATTHIVISEIQLAGASTNDEFVELYNPTDVPISINNWKITKKTEGGTESDIISTMSGTIPIHGYFLIARSEYDDATTPNITYSDTLIANNNTILVYNDTFTLVDKVGLGSATDKEGTTATNPTANHSIERKAIDTSTSLTMAVGGNDELAGNGWDTENNNGDFVQRTVSQPQNSNSANEPPALPSPTDSLTPTPSETPTHAPMPTPTETPIPTPTETLTPTPTESLTPTPTATPSPTDNPTPTPEGMTPTPTETTVPTETPIPTDTPSPTATIAPKPTETPLPTVPSTPTVSPTSLIVQQFPVPGAVITCTWTRRIFPIFGFRFFIPLVQCKTVKM